MHILSAHSFLTSSSKPHYRVSSNILISEPTELSNFSSTHPSLGDFGGSFPAHSRANIAIKQVTQNIRFLSACKFRSVQSLNCVRLCCPIDCSMPGLPVHHQILEFTQTHVHWVSDASQPSHPLSSPSPPTFNLPQHQGLFKWVSSTHQVAKVLERQLQHQFFQWIIRTDFL